MAGERNIAWPGDKVPTYAIAKGAFANWALVLTHGLVIIHLLFIWFTHFLSLVGQKKKRQKKKKKGIGP